MSVFSGGHQGFQCPYGHHFGFVMSGTVLMESDGRSFSLITGMYFSVPTAFSLSGDGKVVLFLRHGYRGLFSVGGPVENRGRLSYIDNATTTLICPPPRNGDPCLSFLSFPPRIVQTQHIHPTVRLGAVISGSGFCVLGSGEKSALHPGHVFVIEEQTVHSFESGDSGLGVIAYHPDSEGGPTDSHHPMLLRTYMQK